MAVNSANARIFGSDNDAVWVAPLGTDLPDDLALPEDPFADVGWLHTDGITVGGDTTVDKFRGHQGGKVIRTKVTESNTTFQFQCLETTALTLGLQFNILDKTSTTGLATATISASRKVTPRAFIIDVFDADDEANPYQYRWMFERGEIGEREEFTLINSDITGYTFTVEVIDEFLLLTNDPAFADDSDAGS